MLNELLVYDIIKNKDVGRFADVSENRELLRLIGLNNQLTSLDISQNNKLNRLWLFGNPLSIQETEHIVNNIKEMSGVDLWIADFD